MDEQPQPVALDPRPGPTRAPGGILCACLLVLLTVVAYVPAFDAGFVFDDSLYLTSDARVASDDGLGGIWTQVGGPSYRHQYYPLTSSAFWAQRRLWGDRPFGYHLVNVLLHAVNAVLLWRLLARLQVTGAWLAGAVFAVHPVHVQSVAWIAELKNVLSTCFFLLSMLMLVRWFADRGWWRYVAGLGLFACALLSKTATCLLPAALLLIRWWKEGRLTRRDLVAVTPLAAVGAVFVGVTVYLESRYGGAHGETFSQSGLERMLLAGRALWFYAGKLAWPAGLTFIYPRWEADAAAWWQYLFPLAAIWLLAGLWLWRDRIGRGPVAAVGYFALAVVPMSFVNVAFTRLSFVADHWQYWASMGLITLAVGVGAAVVPRRIAPAAAAAVLVTLSVLTWQRARVYESPKTLWQDTLARNPDAWVAHNNLAIALAAEGRVEEAIEHYREAIRIHPRFAEAHNNLAHALLAQGRLEEACMRLEAAVRIDGDFAVAHYNLGNVLRRLGRPDEGLAHYDRALEIDPDYQKVHNNYGAELITQGRLDEAIVHLQRALELDPDDPGTLYNLGLARRRQASAARLSGETGR